MQTARKTQARSGRLVLDPQATPREEADVALPADPTDDLDEKERAELDALLDESLEDARAGRLVSNEDAFRNMERAERAVLASR